ncbi:hypothetical protein BU25DRAFT_491979 [Macroventuria anomochaeta]|uniref:Uncharacterized protein n=1 Tax=Macroventuria anomochaeta TaxID=301207 RepID=A0ACB6RZE6_9PLEO|nr:uncharacterized protein BU25DRAFT_491979 [Macroventuria anomochaeta]KAF2626637.1 hypothetical protein BU25DRAFT_491979 [Macroventuria anomochaeta]
MAPAAHHRYHPHHHRKAITVTYVEHKDAHDVTSLYEIVLPSALTSNYAAPSFSPDNDLSLSLSLSPPPTTTSTPLSFATTASNPSTAIATATRLSSQTTTSNYPRPSPPTFLYPEPIVPPHVYEYNMQRDALHGPQHQHHSLAHKANHQTPTAPLWLVIFVFAVIGIAAAWSVVVCLIHWRGTTTGMVPQSYHEQREGGGAALWAREIGWSPFAGKRKGRYEVLHTNSSEEINNGAEMRRGGRTSAHDVPFESAYSAQDQSPVNPYLVPPDQHLGRRPKLRCSTEWAEEHRAFFSSSSSRSPAAHSRGSSSTQSLSGAELEDVESEACEAQGRRASRVRETGQGDLDRRANRSWVDLGLAVVDRAVDRVAARIVRWTDDGGRDEELVLPLAKGKQD